jgi:hypothetical protein
MTTYARRQRKLQAPIFACLANFTDLDRATQKTRAKEIFSHELADKLGVFRPYYG